MFLSHIQTPKDPPLYSLCILTESSAVQRRSTHYSWFVLKENKVNIELIWQWPHTIGCSSISCLCYSEAPTTCLECSCCWGLPPVSSDVYILPLGTNFQSDSGNMCFPFTWSKGAFLVEDKACKTSSAFSVWSPYCQHIWGCMMSLTMLIPKDWCGFPWFCLSTLELFLLIGWLFLSARSIVAGGAGKCGLNGQKWSGGKVHF